jgi:bifunctional DNase/RNase
VVALDATVSHILISDLRDEVYYATIVIEADGRVVEVDARPSDAINLAVRTSAAIFVAERVLDAAGIKPESSLDTSGEEDEDLSVFADFVESLDLDDLGDE